MRSRAEERGREPVRRGGEQGGGRECSLLLSPQTAQLPALSHAQKSVRTSLHGLLVTMAASVAESYMRAIWQLVPPS